MLKRSIRNGSMWNIIWNATNVEWTFTMFTLKRKKKRRKKSTFDLHGKGNDDDERWTHNTAMNPMPTRRRFIQLRLFRSFYFSGLHVHYNSSYSSGSFLFFFYSFHSVLGTKIELAIHEFLCRGYRSPLTNDSIVLPLFITPNGIACVGIAIGRNRALKAQSEIGNFVPFSFMQNGLMCLWAQSNHCWIANPRDANLFITVSSLPSCYVRPNKQINQLLNLHHDHEHGARAERPVYHMLISICVFDSMANTTNLFISNFSFDALCFGNCLIPLFIH